jgi:fucose permease
MTVGTESAYVGAEDDGQDLPGEQRPLLVPQDETGTEAAPQPRWQQPDTFKLIAVIYDFFVMGICQTAPGALIPSIEEFYRLGDGATASIFVAHTLGYLCATTLIQSIHFRFGRRGIALLSPFIRLCASLLLATGPPFKFTLVIYGLFGFGVALVDIGWCTWATSLPYSNICQGMMHGSFSTGSIIGPLVATLVSKRGYDWNAFYVLAVSRSPLLPGKDQGIGLMTS